MLFNVLFKKAKKFKVIEIYCNNNLNKKNYHNALFSLILIEANLLKNLEIFNNFIKINYIIKINKSKKEIE